MKRAGQHWFMTTARKLAMLRRAQATGGALGLYDGIKRAQGRPPSTGVADTSATPGGWAWHQAVS